MYVPPLDVDRTIRSATSSRALSREEVLALRALPYAEYLQSSWWRARRNDALRAASYRCQRCESKRDLEVHHLTYERLGAELPGDLDVLCRGCHLGEHSLETRTFVSLYMRVLSDIIRKALPDAALPDLLEAAKQRCAELEIPYRHTEFHAAVSRVLQRIPFTPPKGKEELFKTTTQGQALNRSESAVAITLLRNRGLVIPMRHMPEVKPLKSRQVSAHNALRIFAQAILDSIQTCEDAEKGG
jgi:5-methylcytosine-specific restriction endonuclease McrA